MNSTDNISVSVILVARNEEQFIEQSVNSIINGTNKSINLEIIVVDGMSNDNTVQIVNNLQTINPKIQLIQNQKKITPVGLNLGVRSAKHEYIMIAGAHTKYPDNYIGVLIHYLNKLNADGAGGQLQTEVYHKNKVSMSIAKVLAHPLGVGNSKFRIGVKSPELVDTVPFGIYRKSLFDEVGYYNEKLVRNHDIEWSMRLKAANKKIYLIPDVSCTYYARETYSALAKNNFQNGLWNILTVFITKNRKSLNIRHFVPFGFVSFLAFTLIIGFFVKCFLYVFAATILSYLTVLTIISFKLRDKQTGFFQLLGAFIVLHFSYGLGSITGVFQGIWRK